VETPRARVDAASLERGLERTFIPSSELPDVLLDVATVRRLLRCDEAAVAALVAAGLPAFDPDRLRFRRSDILNVGLNSGSGRTIPEIAEAHRVRFAAGPRHSWIEPRAWEVCFDLRCPRSCGSGSWLLSRPSPERFGGAVQDWPAGPVRSGSPLRLEGRVVVTGVAGTVRSGAAQRLFVELVDDLTARRIRYQYLPPGLRRDPEAAAARGVLDCMAASLLLERRCRDLGLRCRTRKGLLLGPAAVEHVWLELPGADADWVPVDPVLATLVSRSVGVEGFTEFACGSSSNRLLPWELGAEADLVEHDCSAPDPPSPAEAQLATVSARTLSPVTTRPPIRSG
jgi:hypothetical protein